MKNGIIGTAFQGSTAQEGTENPKSEKNGSDLELVCYER
jgi:hypothetical protein